MNLLYLITVYCCQSSEEEKVEACRDALSAPTPEACDWSLETARSQSEADVPSRRGEMAAEKSPVSQV